MNIESLMTRDVKVCQPTSKLDEAVELMRNEDFGCLPVVSKEGGRELVGVVTDRDICLAAHRLGKKLGDILVREAMSEEVHSCRGDDDVAKARELMSGQRVRRLPVVEDGQLKGMLSLAQLARASQDGSAKEVRAEHVGETLAAICQPAGPR